MLFSRKLFAALLAVTEISAQSLNLKDYPLYISYCSSYSCYNTSPNINQCYLFETAYQGRLVEFSIDRSDYYCLYYA